MHGAVQGTALIGSREEVCAWLVEERRLGKTIGFTSGTFDLLHRGHVAYLEEARRLCDVLVVGVNSDISVKSYKGPTRPIIPAEDRAQVVAALRSVDYVFIFDDRNNNRSIELLTPDIYIKAGDYAKDKLSSAPIVESYGGKVALVGFVPERSTSSIIERIGMIAGTAPVEVHSAMMPRPALFLDRDGTIIEFIEYLHDPAKVAVIPGAMEAIRRFQDAGYRIIMVTNQPGISMGYFTIEDFFRVNAAILRQAAPHGVLFDKLYFCPHSNADRCDCRKPLPGMLERAERELRIDRSRSIFVGDSAVDVEAAKRFGCRAVLLQREGTGRVTLASGCEPDHVVASWEKVVPFDPD